MAWFKRIILAYLIGSAPILPMDTWVEDECGGFHRQVFK